MPLPAVAVVVVVVFVVAVVPVFVVVVFVVLELTHAPALFKAYPALQLKLKGKVMLPLSLSV